MDYTELIKATGDYPILIAICAIVVFIWNRLDKRYAQQLEREDRLERERREYDEKRDKEQREHNEKRDREHREYISKRDKEQREWMERYCNHNRDVLEALVSKLDEHTRDFKEYARARFGTGPLNTGRSKPL